MIRHVRVEGYKSLKHVDLALEPLTVIFGPNAAGKSNLHDVLGLVSRLATTRNLREAFDTKVHRGTVLEAFSYGPGGLEELLKKDHAELTIEVDVELSQAVIDYVETRIRQLQEGLPNVRPRQHVKERRLRYKITLEVVPSTGVLRVKDEYMSALKANGTPVGNRAPFIERSPDNRLHLRIEGQAHPTYHPLGLDYTLSSSQLYPPHYPHVTAFREELSRWHFYYLEPNFMRNDSPVQEVDILNRDGSNLASFFHTFQRLDPTRFEGISKTLGVLLPLVQDLEVRIGPTGFAELSIRESGIRFSSRLISEGTLRILGLLAIMRPRQPVSVVGYEEPENGVHPRRLSIIADLFAQALYSGTHRADTQYVINTHSPTFLEKLQSLLKSTSSIVLVACTQGENGSTEFERIQPGSLFAHSMAQAILEGQYGG